jgi:hypothetical protein
MVISPSSSESILINLVHVINHSSKFKTQLIHFSSSTVNNNSSFGCSDNQAHIIAKATHIPLSAQSVVHSASINHSFSITFILSLIKS